MEQNDAIKLLQDKAEELGRLPKRNDFTPIQVAQIKAKLGPWNRALEQAGLKEISPLYVAKREKIAAKKAAKKIK